MCQDAAQFLDHPAGDALDGFARVPSFAIRPAERQAVIGDAAVDFDHVPSRPVRVAHGSGRFCGAAYYGVRAAASELPQIVEREFPLWNLAELAPDVRICGQIAKHPETDTIAKFLELPSYRSSGLRQYSHRHRSAGAPGRYS